MRNKLLNYAFCATFFGMCVPSYQVFAQTQPISKVSLQLHNRYDYLQRIEIAYYGAPSKEVFIARQKQKYGILDSEGRTLLSFEYDHIAPQKGYLVFKKADKYGFALLDELEKTETVQVIYDQLICPISYCNYMFVKKDMLWGCFYKNSQILAPSQDSLYIYSDGGNDGATFFARLKGKWGSAYFLPKQYTKMDAFAYQHKDLPAAYGVTKNGLPMFNPQHDQVPTTYEALQKSPYAVGHHYENGSFGYEHFYYAKKNGKWGLVDTLENPDKQILPFEYDLMGQHLSEASGDVEGSIYTFFLSKNGKWGQFNPESNSFDLECEYDSISPNYDVLKNGKWGKSAYQKGLIIPCSYENIQTFAEYETNKSALFAGDEFEKEKFYLATTTHNQLIFNADGTKRLAYEEIIPSKKILTDYEQNYQQIRTAYQNFIVRNNDKWGLVDATGTVEILPLEASAIQAIYPKTFAGSPRHFYLVQKSGSAAFFEQTAPETCTPFGETYQAIVPMGEFFAAKKAGKWGLLGIDLQTVLIPFEYAQLQASRLPNQLMVEQAGKYGIVTPQHKFILPLGGNTLALSPSGSVWVKQVSGFALMADKGKITDVKSEVLPTLGDAQYQFELIQQQGKTFILYPQTNKTYPLDTYESIRLAGTGNTEKPYLYARKNGKWGLIDTKNMQVLGFEYDEIHSFDLVKGIFEVTKNGARIRINEAGKTL